MASFHGAIKFTADLRGFFFRKRFAPTDKGPKAKLNRP
jgi:hypothetical protein